ncbi:MAG: tetratricopeptide repeat protein, partial [Bacteroidota bacterium]
EKVYGVPSERVAVSYLNLGFLLDDAHQWQEAIDATTVGMAMLEQVGARNSHFYRNGLSIQANAMTGMGRDEEALSFSRRVYQETREANPNNPARWLSRQFHLGVCLKKCNRTREAAHYLTDTRKKIEELGGQSSGLYAKTLFQLGDLSVSLDRTAEGIAYIEEATELFRIRSGGKGNSYASCLNRLGEIHLELEQLKTAQFYFESTLEALRSISTDFTPSDILDPGIYMQASIRLSRTNIAMIQSGENPEEMIRQELQRLRQLATFLDLVRVSVVSQTEKEAWLSRQEELCALGVDLSVWINRLDPAKKEYQAVLLYFAEKSKANLLIESRVLDQRANELD